MNGTFTSDELSNIIEKARSMRDIEKTTIEMAALGDMGAFEEIYRTFSSTVYTLAFGITRNRHDAEEVTQDVFVKIYRGIKDFKFGSLFGTWIYRIAVNAAINMTRARARRISLTTYTEEVAEKPDVAMSGVNLETEQKDAVSRVGELLKGLSAEHRACIVLREIEGLDYKEMSDSLGIPINTVRSRLKRAREALILIARRGGHKS